MRQVFVFLVLALLTGCGTASLTEAESQSVDQLLNLMRQRLSVMVDVARWKWNEKKPIADPDREKALLDAVAARAREKGVDPRLAQRFFRAQIEAAKQLQEHYFTTWKGQSQGRFADTGDLSSTREKIDGINADLISALDSIDVTRAEILTRIRERGIEVLAEFPAPVRESALQGITSPVK